MLVRVRLYRGRRGGGLLGGGIVADTAVDDLVCLLLHWHLHLGRAEHELRLGRRESTGFRGEFDPGKKMIEEEICDTSLIDSFSVRTISK